MHDAGRGDEFVGGVAAHVEARAREGNLGSDRPDMTRSRRDYIGQSNRLDLAVRQQSARYER